MRIIFLNIWFGAAGKPFFDFIKKESLKTDIFCLMEVTSEILSGFSVSLPGFNSFFTQNSSKSGQAIFVREKIEMLSSGKRDLYEQSEFDNGCLQKVELSFHKHPVFVGSVHGKTLPGNKLDTDLRIQQSGKIIDAFAKENGPKIIGGDFNLELNTKSVKLFEENGYRNLIKDFGIENTRNRISWEEFHDFQRFADYVFTSPEVKVKNFEVPYMEISDHLPLILDFEI